MFNVKNIETGRTVKHCDCFTDAVWKLESLEHNGKKASDYEIVPTKEMTFRPVDTYTVNLYRVYTTEYYLEVSKRTESGKVYYKSRLLKDGEYISMDLMTTMCEHSRQYGKFSEWYEHDITEECYVAMMMNGIFTEIEMLNEIIDGWYADAE